MIITNLFENAESGGGYYHEQVAEKLPAGLKSEDDILDAAWEIVVKDLGRIAARNKFMDEDFESDVIGAYRYLHKTGVAEGEVYDLEKEYGYEKPKAQPKRASVPPIPRDPADDGYEGSRAERRLRADQERVKAAWAAHNAKKGVAEGIMNTIANKVMGAAPEQPKYKVGQRVKYETSPHQPDWKDGGRGVGVITAYKNGHYMINGNPVNHFEIKGVVDQGVAEGWKEKVATGLTAASMAAGAHGVVLNPARPIGPKGQTVANPYPNKTTNTKSAEDDAWAKIEKRKAADKKDVAEGSLEEYGDTALGQKMLTKVQKRAVDRVIRADDKNRLEPDVNKRDLKTVRKNAATADRAWDRMTDLDESRMSELDAEYEDYKKLSPREFYNMYRITKQAWLAKYKSMLPVAEADAQVNGQDVDVGVVVSKLKKFVANAEQQLQNADYDQHQQRRYATIVRDRAVKALDMIAQGGNTPEAADAAFKYMQTGKQDIAEELAMQHQRDHRTQKFPDTSNSLAKRTVSLAAVPNITKTADGYPSVRGRADSTHKAVQTRVEPTITPTSVKRSGSEKPIPSFLQKGVAEADKKKEDELEPQVKDVALQRAISRAKADFPTAGTGIEALAKDFMRSQDQDSKSFDQLRQAERKQDQMLGQIAKIDQEQEQEIKGLEDQNSTLASRLQQLQNVNSELEKKLAAMNGRREKRKDKSATSSSGPSLSTTPVAPAMGSTTEPDTITPEPSASPVIGRMAQDLTAEPSKSKAIGQIAKTLSPPSSAIDQMTQQLQPRQKELPLGEPNVLDPDTKSGRRINTSKAVDAPYRDVSVKMAKKLATDPAMRNQMYNADALRNLAGQEEMPLENKHQDPKTDRPEAKYNDKYQDMVKRMGQKAREQEKSKPVDIADLARRLAAIEASRKD